MPEIKENVLLASCTIYKIGGPARYFTEVKNADEIKEAIQCAEEKKIPFFVLGAGSNMLVSDRGFDGLAIRMSGGEVKTDGERLIADAGVMMARAVMESARAGMSGFEWGVGIPGIVGGSVRGNAGCFGGEMKDVVESVEIFDASAAASRRLAAAECKFAYRDSIFKKHPEWVIVSATLKLKKGQPEAIQNEIRRITAERAAKQNIGAKSCGCVFKNIPWLRRDIDREKLLADFPELERFSAQENIPASFLIDRAGEKGVRAGAVYVSDKHANYFINDGGGAAADVAELAAVVKDAVKSTYGILLEEEIQYIGF